jgi:hypothetical protein
MSDVGHVTIDPVARGSEVTRHVRTMVNVGGALVQVECDSNQDAELDQLIDRLFAKLGHMAVEVVHTSLHTER